MIYAGPTCLVRARRRPPRLLQTRLDLHRQLDLNPVHHLGVQIHVNFWRPDTHHQGIAHGSVVLP